MYEIIYASAATRRFKSPDLAELLEAARLKNAKLDVSGILLHEEGSFLQVLEGAEDTVKTLFARISADERHGKVLVLRQRIIEDRSFSKWSMGLVSLDAQLRQALPESHGFSSNGTLQDSASNLTAVLDAFRGGRWHNYIHT